jgi:hypothetical protein
LATLLADVNTLRRTFESFTHFNCPTCYAVYNGALELYAYAEVAAVYINVPCEGTHLATRLPVAHLVKVLNTCVTNSMARLTFLADHLRVENEVDYRVEYVKGAMRAMEYPTVRASRAFIVGLPILHRFLKLVDDTVTFTYDEDLTLNGTYQDVVKSKLTFPPYKDMYIHFGVPLVTNEPWPEDVIYTSDLVRQLCRTQSFQTTGVLVVGLSHCVFTSERNGICLKVCFTSV